MPLENPISSVSRAQPRHSRRCRFLSRSLGGGECYGSARWPQCCLSWASALAGGCHGNRKCRTRTEHRCIHLRQALRPGSVTPAKLRSRRNARARKRRRGFWFLLPRPSPTPHRHRLVSSQRHPQSPPKKGGVSERLTQLQHRMRLRRPAPLPRSARKRAHPRWSRRSWQDPTCPRRSCRRFQK